MGKDRALDKAAKTQPGEFVLWFAQQLPGFRK